MDRLCQLISLDGDWTMEGMDYNEGLGRGAYWPNYIPEEPVVAHIPCTVQTALLEAKRIEDPYWEMNNEKILWIEDKEWWFFRDITIPENINGKNYQLIFESITYRAEVFLDGITIGKLEGSFLRFFLDITKYVKPGKTYKLALRIRALENSSEDRPGGSVKRGMVRASGVVPGFSYWWNWSPHLVPIGIWKSVWLQVTGGVEIRDPYIRTKIHWDECEEAQYAEVSITVDITSSLKMEEEIVIKGTITGDGFDGEVLELREFMKIPSGHQGQLTLNAVMERPQLWWPIGMGKHPIYLLKLQVFDREINLLDTAETEFGVREIDMVKNPDDLWVLETSKQSNRLWSYVGNPYPWTFVVNKKKIFIRGSNWVPMDNLLRFPEERYRLFLDQVENSNLNMLRIWGGGIHETETFYKLLNRKGILAWSEFWFACSNYPVMPHDLFIANAIDMVKCVRNHPCIAMWSGGNEYNPDSLENKDLVNKLAQVIKQYDADRKFRRGSPYKGDRHGGLLMMPTRTSNKYNGDILNGDQRLTIFRAEVAMGRSMPAQESLKKFISADKLWPPNLMNVKQIYQYHHGVVKEQERDAKEYGALDNLEYWIYAGQISHAQIHRHNMEYCRFTKWQSSGCMQWQVTASWPVMHREMIDYWGVPKPVFFAYKRSSLDYLVAVDLEKYVFDGNETVEVDIWAVSDKHRNTGSCQVQTVIYSSSMQEFLRQSEEIYLPENEAVKAYKLKWQVPGDYLGRVFFIHMELIKDGVILAENLQWCGTSNYKRKAKAICLNGPWKFQVGKESKETAWQQCVMPAYWRLPQGPPPEGMKVFYRKYVDIPADWQGTPLEMFCQGFEGNDVVYINGVKIGATEEEMTIEMRPDDLLFTEEFAKRMKKEGKEVKHVDMGYEEQMKSTVKIGEEEKKGDKQNVRIKADPFVVPNLIKRFYHLPVDKVKYGERNLLEVVLYGEYATGISEPVFVREVSNENEQRAIIDMDNDGKYLAELRKLPTVDLDVKVFCDETESKSGQDVRLLWVVENNSNDISFLTELQVQGLDEGLRLLFDDNYFSILPGQIKEISLFIRNTCGFKGSNNLTFSVGGWNTKKKNIKEKIALKFI